MKKSKFFLYLLFMPLLQGCRDTDVYTEFSSKIITNIYLFFFLGIGAIWGIHKILNIEKARGWLSSHSSAAKIFSFILGIFSVLFVLIGVLFYSILPYDILSYNTFLGAVLLFISNRLYLLAKCWKEENWEDAKLNSKLITFSIGIFIAIFYLIYFGKKLLPF